MKRCTWGSPESWLLAAMAVVALLLVAVSSKAADHAAGGVTGKSSMASASVERGRYIVKIGGCNDCHTPGFTQANGQIDERLWLTGDVLGWQGAWGTTFAINLRRFVAGLTEEQWVQVTRNSQAKPPMPVWVFRDMTEADLRSVYRFVRSLGAAGDHAPAYLPPGQATKLPLVKFPQ